MVRMRVELLAAMGLLASGCDSPKLTIVGAGSGQVDTSWPADDTGEVDRTCDDAERLTREMAVTLGYVEEEYLVCAGDGQECADPEEMNIWQFLNEALGEHPDSDFCGWTADVVCGPEESITDECCYVMTVGSICEGRPLVIDGERRRAVAADGPWARAAADEHASVASFARHALELMALGAPAELLAEVARAMADEVRHAQLCARRAGVELAPLDAVAGIDASPETVLRALVREACVNETIAAAIAAEAALQASGGDRQLLQDIARDERRHATLAWRSLKWLLQQHPELRTVAIQEFARKVEVGDDSAYGLLDGPAKLAVAERTMRQVVLPCAAQLCRATELSERSPYRTGEASRSSDC